MNKYRKQKNLLEFWATGAYILGIHKKKRKYTELQQQLEKTICLKIRLGDKTTWKQIHIKYDDCAGEFNWLAGELTYYGFNVYRDGDDIYINWIPIKQ